MGVVSALLKFFNVDWFLTGWNAQYGEAIAIIGRRGFNLRCLKSHPTGEENWAYYFYVEGDGNLGSEAGRQMLEELKSVCSSVRLMGSFGRERVLREEPEGKE